MSKLNVSKALTKQEAFFKKFNQAKTVKEKRALLNARWDEISEDSRNARRNAKPRE